MNAREHYAEAERLLRQATDDTETPEAALKVAQESPRWLQAAQTHALMAIAGVVLEAREVPADRQVEA